MNNVLTFSLWLNWTYSDATVNLKRLGVLSDILRVLQPFAMFCIDSFMFVGTVPPPTRLRRFALLLDFGFPKLLCMCVRSLSVYMANFNYSGFHV